MTQSQQQRRNLRKHMNHLRYLKMKDVIFITQLKFPDKTLISVSELKERYRRALQNEFPKATIVF